MGLRFLALACLVGAAFAGPVQRQSGCAKHCNSSPTEKMNFKEGYIYAYQYTSTNNVSFTDDHKQSSGIEGKVEIHKISKCEYELRMEIHRINDPKMSQDEKNNFKRQLSENLRFSLNDGKFEGVCPSSGESTQSLNVKKGCISAFVNGMKDLKISQIVENDRDSLGQCKTSYSVIHQSRGKLSILKKKDLSTCSSRQTITNSYLNKKLLPSVLFEKGTLECMQQFDGTGVMEKVDCHESEKMKALSKEGNSPIRFSGHLELKHLEIRKAVEQEWQEPFNQEEILFGIEESRSGDRNVKEINRILQDMCSRNVETVSIDVGKEYFHLVSLVKSLTYPELKHIYGSLESGSLCSSKKVRDFFADTLPVSGSDPAIRLMIDILVNDDEVPWLKYKLWTASLAMIRNPTKQIAASIYSLLKKDRSYTTLLASSGVIERLCELENCDKIPAVGEIISIFNNLLGPRCSSSDLKQIKVALGFLGNIGEFGKAYENVLACVKDKTKPTRLRLHAISALRKLKTKPYLLLPVYADQHDIAEVRIAAFYEIFSHCNEKQMKEMKKVAEKERDEQVNGFVLSHLRNMNKTSSEKYHEVKHLLRRVPINPPEVTNYWTNSKIIEMSVYNKALGAGGLFETGIIHSNKTKLPKSIFGSLVAGKDFNVAQAGIRFEGFEEILQNIIPLLPSLDELREKISKKPSLDEIKAELSRMSLDKILGHKMPEIDIFLILINKEIFRLSTDDMLRADPMLKMADLMTKLARGKDIDFSHSASLMNTKLIIPSMTGRSYSIGVAGTATLGLTGKTKADFLNLPRNADVQVNFKPSMAIELSTTCGILTNSHENHYKFTTRIYVKGGMAVKIAVKDRHIATVTVEPAEEMVANVSTNIYEKDENHNEKPIIKKMQTKIDYSLDVLEKPLGYKIFAKAECSNPFVLKSMPYIMPVGNLEISMKKTDTSFKEYKFEMEIPKQIGPNMKFRVSCDTPGSRVPRKFAYNLDIKQNKDKKEASLLFTCPFETVRAHGSLTKNEKRIQGYLEVGTSNKQIVLLNTTAIRAETRSKKTVEVFGAYSLFNQPPAKINGSVIFVKGRKQHWSFDIKTNRPKSKPLALKGSIVKEGTFDNSPKGEYKASCELSLKSPLGDFNVRKTIEKRSKPSQVTSVNVGIDYQLTGKQKESLTISGMSQKSSNKVISNFKVEMTQNPRANIFGTWHMQRESSDSWSNDIRMKWGPKLEKTLVHLKQKSSIPKTGPGHCTAILEIPSQNLFYELTLDHDIDMNKWSKLYVKADFCYKKDQHFISLLDLHTESKMPLKLVAKLDIQHPGGHYLFEHQMKKTENNEIEGNAKVQYRPREEFQWQYKYKKLSDDTKFHHEIESSIQTPFSRSPVTGKASVELSSKSLAVAGQVGPDNWLRVHLNEDGESEINVKCRLIEGSLKNIPKDKMNTLLGDFNVNTQEPRRVFFSVIVESLTHKKRVEIEIKRDADRHPKDIISAFTELKLSRNSYVSASKLHIPQIFYFEVAESGDTNLFGDQEATVKASIKNQDPFVLKYKRKTGKNRAEITLTLSQHNENKLEYILVSNLMQTDNKKEFSLQSSLNSSVVNINFKHRLISSKSSLTLRTTLSCTRNNKVYKTEWNSDIHPNSLEMKAQIHTPHVSYEKNAVGFSVQRSDNTISSDISFEYSDNKKVSIQTVIQAQEHGLALTWKSRTPYEPVNDVQINAVIKNKRNEKSLKVDMKVDERSVCKVEGIMRISSGVTDIKGSFKVFNIPKVQLQDLNVQFKSSPNSALLSGNIELKNNKKFSLSSEIRKDDHDISTTSSIVTPYKGWKDAELHLSIKPESSKKSALCYVSVNGEKKGELSIASSPQVVDIKGRLNTIYTPEVSAHVKSENARDSFSISANVMKSTSPLLSLSLNRQSHANGEKLLMQTQKSGKTLLDVEVSQDDHRDNSKQLSFKASGEFPAVSITFSKRNSDPNSLSTELRVCRDVQSKAVCHSLVSNYKSLANSEGHRLLKKFTMDFEKSEGRSSSLTLGRFQVLVSATGNDYILKAIAEADDMKVGTEQKLHIRLHKNDRCSIDSMFYWPKYISKFRGSVLHNAQQFNLEVDALPNKDDLSSKLSLQIKRDIDARNHEHSGLLKLTHSRWSQPILLTYKLQPVERYYVKGKVVIHSGPVGGKSIILEVKPDIQKEAKFMLYKVSIDEKIVAYWNVFRKSSRRDDTIGYEWKYVSPDGEKRGGLTLVFFDKHGGRPKSLKVKWISPSADYEVIGSVAQAPNDVSLSIASNGQKLKEFRVSTSDSCVDFVGPTTKGQICINKREGSEWRLLDAYLQCRGHHCLDFKVVVDPENPDYILVVYKPSKDESCRALWEKVSLKSLLRGHSVKELKQEGLEKLEKFQQDVLEPLLSKWRKALWDLKEDVYSRVKDQLQQHDQMVKEYIRKVKEIKETLLTRIQSVIPESVKEAYRKLSQALLEKMYYYYQKLQETAIRYWPPICENAWFCSDIKSALQKFDAQETKVWVSGKLAELKNYVLQFKLPTLRLIHTSDIVNLFKDCFNRVKQTMDRIFGAFIARIIESRAMLKVKIYLQKIETYFRQKAIDVIDAFIRRVRHIFSEDQDLQNAQHLLLKAKAEVIKAWQNKEEIAQNSMRQIENSVKHKFDEFVKPKFQVLKSEPNDGEYVLKIRQPLTKSDAEDIKHELIQLISKLQDYIRSFLRW